jgi:outer membrane receptor protein involved in Fe transport
MQSPITIIGGVLCLHFLIGVTSPMYAQDSLAKQPILFPASVQELLVIQPTIEATKVTTATKVAQNIFEAPNIINSYKRRDFIDYGFFSFNQLLWLQPNFSMSKDYDRMTVSARGVYEGWNNNHLLLLVDGVPINENIYGSALTWEVTPLVFTKSVEVMRGGGSALYGTNAMNGLLSIQTVSPADLKGNVEARSRISSNGTQIYDAIAGINNEKLSLVASFNHFFTHGLQATSYDASGRTNANGTLQQFALQDRRQSNYFFAKADFKGKFTGLSFQYHEQNWSFGTGHGWLFQVPDQPENLNEGRRIVSFSYTNPNKGRPFNYEAVLRYQSKSIDWNMRFFPNRANFFSIDYPNGVTEVVKTSMDDIFMRGQLSYTFKNKALLLGGVENSVFLYNGDAIHSSNIRLNEDFTPFPDNQMLPIGNYLDYMTNKPLVNIGAFVQLISPKLLREKLTITAGLRFDNQFVNYTDITQTSRPTESKTFAKLSPRLSLVYQATENLYLKAIAGRGFRTPAPAEMFGANTFALASNIRQLQPETVDTYELVADWNINKHLQLRINGFYTDFDNIIAYSV